MNAAANHSPGYGFKPLPAPPGVWARVGFVAKALGFLLLLGLISSNVTVDARIHDTMTRFKAFVHRLSAGGKGVMQSGVVIVRLDDDAWGRSNSASHSLAAPFPREVLAEIIQAVAEARPKVIVLDVALEQATSPEADRRLEQAIKTNSPVILAQDIKPDGHGGVEARPLQEAFAKAAAAAGPSFFKDDRDRLIRRAPLGIESNGAMRFTVPFLAATNFTPRAIRSAGASVPMEFPAPPSNFFPSFSANALLEWKTRNANAREFFGSAIQSSNTAVLIGPFHAASQDHFPVPEWLGDEFGSMRGTCLIGYALHTFRSPRWPWQAPAWLGYALMALFFAWGFVAVCLQVRWPKGGTLNWRSLFPLAYGVAAMGLILWPAWFLPVTLPVAGYGAGRTLGELYCEKFGLKPPEPPGPPGPPAPPAPSKTDPTPSL